MRGIETPIKTLRQKVFTEVAKVAFDSQNINDDIEAIPYKITPEMRLYTVRVFTVSVLSARSVCVLRWDFH